MTQRFSAPAWIFWTIATAFTVLVTRNPVYLSLILGSTLVVYLSLEQRSTVALAWGIVLRIGLVIAGISVLFNVLTVHTGDRQFTSLPSSWPIVGGALTWNAALYGLISGLALLCLLLIAATLSTAVDRSALVRLVPPTMGTIGIAAGAALSMFPQTIAAISQVREAHRARGIQIRGIRDVQRLIIPVLNLGLERAFHLAESMESRGFGNRAQGPAIPTAILLSSLLLATTGVVLVGIGFGVPGAVSLLASIGLVALGMYRFRNEPIARYRVSRLSRADLPVLLTAGSMIGITAYELITGSSLIYSTYPTLRLPETSAALLVACLLPAAPLLVRRSDERTGLAHA